LQAVIAEHRARVTTIFDDTMQALRAL